MIRLIVTLTIVVPVISATLSELPSYYRDGDVIIGGMFPLHFRAYREDNYDLKSQPTVPVCKDYNFRGFRWMQAMLFAIDEINRSKTLLPSMMLGWKIFDTCDTMSRAVTQALTVVDSLRNNNVSKINVLVGPTGSDKSIGVANLLGIFDLPQISYGSTSRTLSNKDIYNSFLRTIPNDDEQATAMVDLLDYYNWTWVGAIAGDDEYGRQGISKFKVEAEKKGICVEFIEYISKSQTPTELSITADRVKAYNATVFVMFISGSDLRGFSEKLRDKGVRDKIWVASEAWATSRSIYESGGEAMHGTLGIATRGGEMKGFREFLESVSPYTQPENPFMKEFWENTFHCSCSTDICKSGAESRRKRQTQQVTTLKSSSSCTGNESLMDPAFSTNAYLQWTDSELEKSYTAYLAIYTIAHALQNISNCVPGSGLLEGGKCPSLQNLESWQLLAYLRQVKFTSPGLDEKFGFDANGDPNATYKLVSWSPVPSVPNGTTNDDIEFVHVGNYSKQHTKRWSLNTGAIYWHDMNGSQIFETPISICSPPCEPGYYRVKLASDCCHKCIQCPLNEFSDVPNAYQCQHCNITDMSNENRTACIPKPEDYIRWSDAFGITFTTCSLIGIILTVISAGIFFHYRNTAIVKATNREISFLLFISICFCFLTPLIYIAKPEDWSCKGRHVSFILSFTLCVAAILVKTLRVLTAFTTTLPLKSRKRSRWLGEHLQVLVVLLVALVQVLLCISWLVAAPPRVVQNYTPVDVVLIECDLGSLALVICVHLYLALLALAAFVLAFRARKLPENFNEAKFITFAMLIFFIVWLSFIPAYITTTGVMSNAVYCIAILTSTFGFLASIFFPKIYIIIVTPERNTTEQVRQTNTNHTFRSASRSVVYKINAEKALTSTLNSSKDKSSKPRHDAKANRAPLRFDTSPCVTRATAQNNLRKDKKLNDRVNRKPGGRQREYNIEINGKLKSKMTSPSRISKDSEIELLNSTSSFDVTLQVNIAAEKTSSERDESSFVESEKDSQDCDISDKDINIQEIEADVQPTVIVEPPENEQSTPEKDSMGLDNNKLKIVYETATEDGTRKRSSTA